jgi:hypothetical protein
MKGKMVEDKAVNFGAPSQRRTAMIAGGSPARQAELAILVGASGCAAVPRSEHEAADYLLVDLTSETDSLTDSLSKIVGYLETHRSIALVWTDMAGLEDAYAALPPGQCHFLVDANDVEAMPILAGAFGRDAMDRLHDKDREVEFGSLHRISDELAEFARALALIADSERKSGVSDKPVSFRPAPIGGFQPFPTQNHPNQARAMDAKRLREMIKLRRLRERFFDKHLFADPAWDILLDLKAAAFEDQKVSVSSLCIAAAVPPTTALRWITAMTEGGMLVRHPDPDDARRVFIALSDETSAKLEDYFAASATRSGQIF